MPVTTSGTVRALLRDAVRKDDEPLNVITFPTHERYETALAATGHRFRAFRPSPETKTWNETYAPVPPGYVLFDPARHPGIDPRTGRLSLPEDLEADLVLVQNRLAQWAHGKRIALLLGIPLIVLEHTLPPPEWSPGRTRAVAAMDGDANVWITESSARAWGRVPDGDRFVVIEHGVDTELFSPLAGKRKRRALSVVNDWKNRDRFCGYRIWEEGILKRGLPVRVTGDNPGLSRPASSVAELVREYREASVFVNTSLVSPVPTALLEAMACGCAVVSTATCSIPEILEHGKNGLLVPPDRPDLLYETVRSLLDAPEEERAALGERARNTILERFSADRFVREWDALFRRVARRESVEHDNTREPRKEKP